MIAFTTQLSIMACIRFSSVVTILTGPLNRGITISSRYLSKNIISFMKINLTALNGYFQNIFLPLHIADKVSS